MRCKRRFQEDGLAGFEDAPRTGRPRFPDAANRERWSALGADSWGAGFEAGSASARRRRRRCPSLMPFRHHDNMWVQAGRWNVPLGQWHGVPHWPRASLIALHCVIATALRHFQRHRRNSAPRGGLCSCGQVRQEHLWRPTHDDVSRGARSFGPYSPCHKGRYTVRTQSAGTSATPVRLQ
jgi:hypothetical protein